MFIFVGDFSYPRGGAPTARIRTIARGLLAHRQRVAVVPLSNAIVGTTADDLPDDGVFVVPAPAVAKRGVRISGSALNKARAMSRVYRAAPSYLRQLLSTGLCAPGRTLFLYGRAFSRLLPFLIVARMKRMNVVLDVVEGLERFNGFGGRLAPLYWDAWLGTHLLPRMVDTVFTITEKLGDRCRAYGARSVHSLPALESWPTMVPSPRPRGKQFRLLYIGALVEKENPAMLFGLIRNLADIRDSLQIDIVGRYGESSTGRRWAERIQSDPCAKGFVQLHGAVDDEELDRLKMNADGFLLLRANTIAEELSFPTRLVEFLKLGKPVYASDVGEIGRVLRDGAEIYLLHATDADEAAARIRSSLSNDREWSVVGIAGYHAGRRAFDRDRHIENLIRLCSGKDPGSSVPAGSDPLPTA